METPNCNILNISIPAGQQKTATIDTKDYVSGSLQVSGDNVGSTLSFEVSNNGTMHAIGGTIGIAANDIGVIPADIFKYRYFRIVSNSVETNGLPLVLCFQK